MNIEMENLAWDSEFFGFPVGRMQLEADVDWNDAMTALEDSDRRLVYVQTDNANADLIAKITAVAPLYDRKTCFRKKVPAAPAWPLNITEYKGGLTTELRQLALASGLYSRFQRDPRLRPWFEKLYTIWIEKSLAGTLADAVLVHQDHERIVGFATVSAKESTGQIGLIAVDPDCRGKGIGTQLLQTADAWYTQHDCKDALVVTQGENAPACNLYRKNGYAIAECTAVCHWWKLS